MAWVLPWRGIYFTNTWLLELTCLRLAQLRSQRVLLGSPWDRTIPTSAPQRTPPGSVSSKHKKQRVWIYTVLNTVQNLTASSPLLLCFRPPARCPSRRWWCQPFPQRAAGGEPPGPKCRTCSHRLTWRWWGGGTGPGRRWFCGPHPAERSLRRAGDRKWKRGIIGRQRRGDV